jgi:predicted GNAT family acetyltransferase
MSAVTDIEIRKNPDARRYEAFLDGERVGFAEYQLTDELVVLTHTEVEDRCEGLGVGSSLARFALDDVRAEGSRKVLPLCPFMKEWIGRHRDYLDLVYGAPPSLVKD